MKTTDTDKAIHSFGRYLQAIRNENGISLETVSKETKIRQDVLIQIEHENFDKLPNSVFMRGFLRAFAGCIGADGEEAVKLYDRRLKVIRKIVKAERDLTKSAKKYWSRLVLSFLALFCVIFFSIFTVSRFGNLKDPDITSKLRKETVKHENKNPKMISSPVVSSIPELNEIKKIPEKYQLQIQAVEETWMKITVDERKPNEYTLNPGDYMEMEAQKGFDLLIGNAGGVKLILNQKTLNIPGHSGEVVNFSIP